jgi:hypothetical protein
MTRYFVETLGGVLVAKHAIGEDRLPDDTVYIPVTPPGWLEVFELETYLALPIGAQVELGPGPHDIRVKARPIPPPPAVQPRPERLDERLARIEGRLALLETPSSGPTPTEPAPRSLGTDGIDWS